MEGYLRIYYDKETGNPIFKVEQDGNHVFESIERNIEQSSKLNERIRDTFDVLELPYGTYYEEFMDSISYRVNPQTKELEFSYPDPNYPEIPPVFVKPLTEQIADVRSDMDNAILELTMVIAMGGTV